MGFEILIQEDLNEKERKKAIELANEFITKTLKNNGTFHFGGRTGGWHSYIRRGIFGYMLPPAKRGKEDILITFRRYKTALNNGNVVFCIVRHNTLLTIDDNAPVNIHQCRCSIHAGGVRVRWVNDKPPETYRYCEINY